MQAAWLEDVSAMLVSFELHDHANGRGLANIGGIARDPGVLCGWRHFQEISAES